MFLIRKDNLFPDEDTPNRLFYGIPFKELPVFNIKVSPNNTIISLTDYKGKYIGSLFSSCNGMIL